MIRFFLLFFSLPLFSEIIETFYGPIEVEEKVLLELIESPPLQRLKEIHQYGVAYYTNYPEEYNRFDHSLGVFALLKTKGASLEEQIAGLLHDVSHTTFSHVGDWVFGKEYQEEDYQSTIHHLYLAVCGIEAILHRHGYTIEQISPKKEDFTRLEQPLPNLCADRIDYNIQGAYHQKFLSREEVKELVRDLQFEQGKWSLSRKDLAVKLTLFSLFMTENCWGSAINYMTSRWLADAIRRGLEIGLVSWKDLHFGVDQQVWDQLLFSSDEVIQKKMERIAHPETYVSFVEPSQATHLIPFKCRAIDPWLREGQALARLSSIDPEIAEKIQQLKRRSIEGWAIKSRD